MLEINDHAPFLNPAAGELCSKGGSLVLSATDEDLAPHAEPFYFHLGPTASASLAHNWSLSHSNGNVTWAGKLLRCSRGGVG